MSNRNKRKGDKAELDSAHWGQANGHPDLDRALGAGRPKDRGDLIGWEFPGTWCTSVKDRETLAIPGWMRELDEQKTNARADHGLLIAKRRGVADPGGWYAVLWLDDLNQLARRAGEAGP